MIEPATNRQQFEEALKEKHPEADTSCFVDGKNRLTDIYCSDFVRHAWAGWRLATENRDD